MYEGYDARYDGCGVCLDNSTLDKPCTACGTGVPTVERPSDLPF